MEADAGVEHAHRLWDQHGRPDWPRLGLIVTPDQRVIYTEARGDRVKHDVRSGGATGCVAKQVGGEREMTERNSRLRQARERLPSERLPACPMSRQELAAKVNRWLYERTGRVYALDERAIARWERGSVKRPSEHDRAALRAVLGGRTRLGVGIRRSPTDCVRGADAAIVGTVM